jgi:hypothetical protein
LEHHSARIIVFFLTEALYSPPSFIRDAPIVISPPSAEPRGVPAKHFTSGWRWTTHFPAPSMTSYRVPILDLGQLQMVRCFDTL